MNALRRASLAALLLAFTSAAVAQSYPAKQVRIVIGNPPGPANDLIMRALAQSLSVKSGQPFVVENRPGADGILGMEQCAKAAPDAHTLCAAAGGALVLNKALKVRLPYDPFRDFTPVVMLGYFDSGLIVTQSLPARSFNELIETAKARPDAVSWAIFGFNSSGNMYAEWLKKSRGAPFFVVPYKGPTQMMQAMLVGEVHVGVFALGQLRNYIQQGRLRVLAVTSESRYPGLPDVPTFSELGIKLPLRPWYGVVTTHGSPPDAIRWLNAEITRLATDPEFSRKVFYENGVMFSPNTPDEMGTTMKRSYEEFVELMKFLGMKPE